MVEYFVPVFSHVKNLSLRHANHSDVLVSAAVAQPVLYAGLIDELLPLPVQLKVRCEITSRSRFNAPTIAKVPIIDRVLTVLSVPSGSAWLGPRGFLSPSSRCLNDYRKIMRLECHRVKLRLSTRGKKCCRIDRKSANNAVIGENLLDFTATLLIKSLDEK